jgi:hypothetical protein
VAAQVTTVEVLRPYIEQTIAETLGLENVKRDGDGDIPIVSGSVVTFARLIEGPTGPILRLISPLLRDVKKTRPLLEHLNQINGFAPYVTFFWAQNQVFCSMDLLAENLQAKEIENALGAVGWQADHLDDLFQKEFGGQRMIEESEAVKPPRQEGGPGYL